MYQCIIIVLFNLPHASKRSKIPEAAKEDQMDYWDPRHHTDHQARPCPYPYPYPYPCPCPCHNYYHTFLHHTSPHHTCRHHFHKGHHHNLYYTCCFHHINHYYRIPFHRMSHNLLPHNQNCSPKWNPTSICLILLPRSRGNRSPKCISVNC
ncbi:hypothetical protein Hanom_Chr12g01145201 [Helianthus anomalus]